tara:strand:- start:1837 stop:2103 length:267 start_codon:yes stop_codon:yes gene_type:complete
MKYDELNSINELNNVFRIDNLKLWEKLQYHQSNQNIIIMNDSVISIDDIEYFIQDMISIIHAFKYVNDFTEHEIEYIKNIVNKIKGLK